MHATINGMCKYSSAKFILIAYMRLQLYGRISHSASEELTERTKYVVYDWI